MKTEIMHFTETSEIQHLAAEKVSTNDNVYGVTWAQLVRDYLKTAYSEEKADAEVVSWGVTYKVLKRREVTAFYDADGNTLFDVENKQLEKEYEWLMNSNGGADANPVKQRAKDKLEKELKAAKDSTFAEPVIGYLIKRCEEDEGIAEDVAQAHKTWKKCFDYIYAQARKQAKGSCAAVRDEVVYEWAEDYYHKDDKAEEEEKAKKEAEARAKRKKAAAENKAAANSRDSKAVAKQSPDKDKNADKRTPAKKEKPKKNSNDLDGQLDMFSLMGM